MNAHQRRVEKRRRERTTYPHWTEFPPSQLHYGFATGFPGIYRTGKGYRLNDITHVWLDRQISTTEEEEEYDQWVKDQGYGTKIKPKEGEENQVADAPVLAGRRLVLVRS